MRWKGRRESDNIEDIRDGEVAPRALGGKGLAAGGGLIGLVVIAAVVLLGGGDLGDVLNQVASQTQAGGGAAAAAPRQRTSAEDDKLRDFVAVVLADTEDVWNRELPRMGRAYEEPKMVLFDGDVRTRGCGLQSSAVGPFYCPGDDKIYLDLGFFQQLSDQLGAPGDFAQAYVIAHEVGHHIQNLLGISTDVHRQKQGLSEAESNELSVRLELQADYLAGMWAHHAARQDLLERGDLEEALNAAAKIGDDTLQRRSGRAVAPDSFTHGTSAQRMRWFKKGLETGDFSQGDTFSARDL